MGSTPAIENSEPNLQQWGDGVDGPRRHRLCQNEVVADLK